MHGIDVGEVLDPPIGGSGGRGDLDRRASLMRNHLHARSRIRSPIASGKQLENTHTNLGVSSGQVLDVNMTKGLGTAVLSPEVERAELLANLTGLVDI